MPARAARRMGQDERRPAVSVIDPRYRDLFAKSAAPEAIEAYLKKARRIAATAEREVVWLTELLATRNEQINDGTWPSAPTSSTEETP